MEDAMNPPEINNQDVESAPLVGDGRGDQILTATCILCEHDHAAVLEEIELATAPESGLNLNEHELGLIRHKRVELDNIQKDLNELMNRLNIFIAEVDDNSIDDEIDTSSIEEHNTEKQDGPSEKELRLNDDLQSNSKNFENDYYTSEPSKPPEINWNSVGPILQKHVSDLQKIHVLNQMTNAVVQRIRSVAHVDESILKIQPNEENCK